MGVVAACTPFSDGGGQDTPEGGSDADAVLDGSPSESAANDGGSVPFIRGLAKSGGLTLMRPSTAKTGDLLVLIATQRGGVRIDSASFGNLTSIGH